MKKSIIVLILLAYQFSYSQWQSIHPFSPTIQCSALAVSGNNVFAGSKKVGIYLSTDKGQNWVNKSVGLDIKPVKVNAIAISGNNVFVATADSGVYLSTNMGVRWENRITGLSELNVTALAANGSNVFAGTNGAGIFFSSDNGGNWTQRNNGLSELNINTIVVKGENIFIGTNGDGIFYSSDMGSSWTVKNAGLTDKEDSTIYSIDINGNNVVAGTGKGVFISTDLGENWSRKYPYGRAVAVTFKNNKIYAGFYTYPGVLEISTDMGNTWERKEQGLVVNYKKSNNTEQKYIQAKQFLSLAVIENNIIAGTQEDGILVSTDGGEYFEGKTFCDFRANKIIISGENIFVSSYMANIYQDHGGGIYISTNMGNSWRIAGFQGLGIHDMSVKGDTLFALHYYDGLYYSTDLGITWSVKDTSSFPKYAGLRTLVIDGSNWAIATVTSGVLLSTDSGNSWEIKNDGFGTAIYSIAFKGDNIFAGTGGTQGGKGVYLSTDMGDSWAAKGLDGLHIYAIEVNGNHVFAGTNDGFYRSTDFGESWERKFKDNVSNGIKSIKLYENNLYISAFGQYAANKLYISTDMGETWFARDTTIAGSIGQFSYGDYIFEDLVFRGEYVYTVVTPTSMIFKAKLSDLLNITDVEEKKSEIGTILYPNPAEDFITIQSKPSEGLEPSVGYKVQIFDMLGIEIKNLTPALSMNGEGVRIDVSDLPAGVYFIRIGDKTEKFVKM